MNTMTNSQDKPWQNTTFGMEQKLRALFYNGHISDLTITFPGTNVQYKAHKVILAMSSSIFEGMFFGPMAITGSELELPDDSPEAFKRVLAHCYDIDVYPDIDDIDVALEVYMLADKYFIEQLVEKFNYHIGRMLNSDNICKVLEFASNFNFDVLKSKCYDTFRGRYIHNRYDSYECDLPDQSNALLVLRKEWLKELLDSGLKLTTLVFEKSWENPEKVLCDDNILQVLKSKNCRKNGLEYLTGCVSAKVVNYLCRVSFRDCKSNFKQLRMSFNNLQQANEIISILEKVKYPVWLDIHLQCKMFPADGLRQLSINQIISNGNHMQLPSIFISNVDDDGIDWVVSAMRSLKPPGRRISFPRSKLTLDGLKSLLTQLAMVYDDVGLPDIEICSSEISSDISSNNSLELLKWTRANSIKMNDKNHIFLYESNRRIFGWPQKRD